MSRITVVGSGASGVHFALTALKKGHEVAMIDVGHEKPETVRPDLSFDELKGDLADGAGYFLGAGYESLTLPGAKGEVYAFPPNKRYIFKGVPDYQTACEGIEPYASFAQGGLAEAWTGGVYPFNNEELADWPVDYDDLDPYYSEVAARIGINGARDDLARFFPVHGNIMEPGHLDRHSEVLLRTYDRKRPKLQQKLGVHLGRSRISTLTKAALGRSACSYCGRCMWGCPTEALYTPSITLQECLRYPNFKYVRGFYVRHFVYDDARRITAIVATAPNGTEQTFPVENLALAAGTLSSTRIVLESIYRETGKVQRLHGLMDNRQILVPYLNIALIGAANEPRNYQYHQVAMGLESEDGDPRTYVHGQITTLTTGLVHPIIQNLPLNLGTAMYFFRTVRAGLGVVNINLHDTRRPDNYVTIEPVPGGPSKLVAHYTSTSDEPARIKRVLARTRQALWKLGCIVPPPMVHVRHLGAGVHYTGTLPMSKTGSEHTVTPECRSNDFSNLYVADGCTFPFLPAKNLTFTLMANATRTADLATF